MLTITESQGSLSNVSLYKAVTLYSYSPFAGTMSVKVVSSLTGSGVIISVSRQHKVHYFDRKVV
ncbi:MAG: hypothetical protein LBI45_07855 [Bacteroidales bacterium]|jgi:hypothetical protein|nr:hypothetical protein [Bacteroidales bacterium]